MVRFFALLQTKYWTKGLNIKSMLQVALFILLIYLFKKEINKSFYQTFLYKKKKNSFLKSHKIPTRININLLPSKTTYVKYKMKQMLNSS